MVKYRVWVAVLGFVGEETLSTFIHILKRFAFKTNSFYICNVIQTVINNFKPMHTDW
jgi:hypothetical protein